MVHITPSGLHNSYYWKVEKLKEVAYIGWSVDHISHASTDFDTLLFSFV